MAHGKSVSLSPGAARLSAGRRGTGGQSRDVTPRRDTLNDSWSDDRTGDPFGMALDLPTQRVA